MQSLENHHYPCSCLILKYFVLIHDYFSFTNSLICLFIHFSFISSTLLCTGQTFSLSSRSKYSAACSIVSQIFHTHFRSNMPPNKLTIFTHNPTPILLHIQCFLSEQRPNSNDAQARLNFLSLDSVRSFNFLIINL